MTLTDLKHKVDLLKELKEGTDINITAIGITVTKEQFKLLNDQCDNPRIYEPSEHSQNYYFIHKIEDYTFVIYFKPKTSITYETL